MSFDGPRSATYRMADRLLEGKLADRLRELRSTGSSYEVIARTLFVDVGIETSGATIGKWCRQLGIEVAA